VFLAEVLSKLLGNLLRAPSSHGPDIRAGGATERSKTEALATVTSTAVASSSWLLLNGAGSARPYSSPSFKLQANSQGAWLRSKIAGEANSIVKAPRRLFSFAQTLKSSDSSLILMTDQISHPPPPKSLDRTGLTELMRANAESLFLELTGRPPKRRRSPGKRAGRRGSGGTRSLSADQS
jgi:hypothetical protein